MSADIELGRLAACDIGKTITITHDGFTKTATIAHLAHLADNTTILGTNGRIDRYPTNTVATITGTKGNQ